MALGPLDEQKAADLPQIEVLGRAAPLVEVAGTYTGMMGPPKDGAMLLATLCPLGTQCLFIKMVGPEAAVKAEKARFIGFCESFELEATP